MAEWLESETLGKRIRLRFLTERLGLCEIPPTIRYQLRHRAASAVLEAERFNASHALMLVHSFSQTHEWFEDYRAFAALFGVDAQLNRVQLGRKLARSPCISVGSAAPPSTSGASSGMSSSLSVSA